VLGGVERVVPEKERTLGDVEDTEDVQGVTKDGLESALTIDDSKPSIEHSSVKGNVGKAETKENGTGPSSATANWLVSETNPPWPEWLGLVLASAAAPRDCSSSFCREQ
jgi:hypothetical protein